MDNEPLDLGEILDAAEAAELADVAAIKEALPITFVMDHYGMEIEGESSGGLRAYCKFHEDKTTPAFTVFGDNLERWNCWVCVQQPGDVVDLIQKFEPDLSFGEACDKGRSLVTQMGDSDWDGPVVGKKRPELDIDKVALKVKWAKEHTDIGIIAKHLTYRRRKDGPDTNRFDAAWLVREFGVGTWGKKVLVPYFKNDGSVLTTKERLPDGKLDTEKGSILSDVLYNGWRTDMLDAPVFVCEGESDTWNAQYEIGDTHRVLGLSVGAMQLVKDLSEFAGKEVFIAFDTDEAGRKAMRRWATELSKVGAFVRIVPIPEGKDVSSCSSSLRRLVSRARSLVVAPPGLVAADSGYKASGGMAVSNFVFHATRELVGEDGVAYEGYLTPGGNEALITDYDLKNKAAMVTWARKNRRAWFGTDREVTLLLGTLQADAIYLPAGSMTSVAGLHDNHFVWPGHVIGNDYWKYVPPVADTHLDETMDIEPGSWDPEYLHTLRNLHKRKIMDPMLGWLAAVPLRSLFKEFPVLAISGPHGSGKTRTTETLLRGFTGTFNSQTLTNTSPHSIMSSMSGTNAFVQHWDEYRPGAKADTKLMFDQVLRDCYTMQKSTKGGGGGNYMAIMQFPTTAPVLVTGEDMFSEGSHVERMILLQIYRDGQNPDAFAEANSWRNNGLPYAYLTWLHRSLLDGSLDDLRIVPSGPADLAPRQRINIGVIMLGWHLLQRFMEDAHDSLGDPDFSMVTEELREANEHTPIEDAIHYCLAESDAQGFVLNKAGNVRVRVDAFVKFITDPRQGHMFVLPGRAPAIKKYLQMKYGAVEVKENLGGLRQIWLEFDFDKIAR